MKELDFYSDRMRDAQEITNMISNYLNNFSYGETSAYFNSAMSREHRTLQQNFARLIFSYIEFMASDDYRTDGRNADSKRISEDLINAFSQFIKEKYHTNEEESRMPSKWLGTV